MIILILLPFQVFAKIHALNYSDDISWMANFILGIYKVNSTVKDKKRLKMFHTCSLASELIFKLCGFLYFSFSLTYAVYPVYMYFFQNEVVSALQTFLPGVDETTTEGFIVTVMYHMILIILGSIGFAASDLLITLIIINTPIMAASIEDEINQLNDMLRKKNNDSLAIKYKLRNIFLMHQDMTM